MGSLTCIPVNVYHAFYKFNPVFRCVQAHRFWRIKLWARNGEAVRQAIELGELVHHLKPSAKLHVLRALLWGQLGPVCPGAAPLELMHESNQGLLFLGSQL